MGSWQVENIFGCVLGASRESGFFSGFLNQTKHKNQKMGPHSDISFSCDWQFESKIILDACIILNHDD